MDALDFMGAVGEIGEAAKFLLAEGSPKVGITGFCMGGALTLLAAAQVEGLRAAAPFYGIPGHPAFDAAKIKIPVRLARASRWSKREQSRVCGDVAGHALMFARTHCPRSRATSESLTSMRASRTRHLRRPCARSS